MIGFNAPELGQNNQPRQCYTQRSIERLKSYFKEDRTVYLEIDKQAGETDKYGRHLRYVSNSQDTDIAQDMISNGFGHEMTVQPYSRQDEYTKSQ